MASHIKDLKKNRLPKKLKSQKNHISEEYKKKLEKIRSETHKKGKTIRIGSARDFSNRYGL